MDFWTYFQLGFEHISDINGYDHILFIAVMCCVYRPTDWKRVAWLVTAFTVGHSITLALATFGWVKIDKDLIEFLIPVTIALTAIWNVTQGQKIEENPKDVSWNYLIVAIFGLIHGFGFSNFSSMFISEEDSFFMPLLSFNLGVEAGQLLILAIILGIAAIFILLLKVRLRDWTLFVSGAAFGVALILIKDSDFMASLFE